MTNDQPPMTNDQPSITYSTIAAIATPQGSGGIGIIKISGKKALPIAVSLFQKIEVRSQKPETRNQKPEVRSQESEYRSQEPEVRNQPTANSQQPTANNTSFKSHHLYYGHIIDPENGQIIDEVLLAVMLAPYSYTCEDIVEIQAHSGSVILKAILELVLKQGARLAEPGEFTKRAFLNGRIDLTQAEAVIDIINAKSGKALEIATAQLKGNMKSRIESIRNRLLHILAEIEAAIDFPEDVEEMIQTDALCHTLQTDVIIHLNNMICQYENAHFLRDGIKVAIVGRPNVGKSSIMNCLLQKERAIVTSVPGTTRDFIEEPLNIKGIPIILTDTAGLHKSNDPVETIGIQKTQEYIGDVDLVLFTVDLSKGLAKEDYSIYERIAGKKVILVMNKSDLVEDNYVLPISDSWNTAGRIRTSALYHTGIEELKEMISNIFIESPLDMENSILPNLRHRTTLEQTLQAVLSAIEAIRTEMPFEVISIDIQEAIDALGEIIGITVREDILTQIFSRFCIGK